MTSDEEFAEFAETAFTALGGLLADLTSTRTALAVAGLLVLTSPLLLPSRLGASSGTKVRPSRA